MDQRKLERDLLADFGPIMTIEDVSQVARLLPEDIWDQYQVGALAGFEPINEGDVRFTSTAVAKWLSELAEGSPDESSQDEEDGEEEGDNEEDGEEDEDEEGEIVEERVVVRRRPRRK